MRLIKLIALLSLFCAIACRAQTPIPATPCELIASPEKYSEKVVQVRAHVNLEFEDFSLAQEGCEDAFRGVWLIFGGDVPTPTKSTVNDTSRKPRSVLKIDGQPIPLVHDASLALFRRRLNTMRQEPIGKRPCYNCYLYRVTATLTGVFFAATDDAESHSGYGHLGCCHLLAIEQVSDVDAERTQIPMGGSFRCVDESRTLSAIEADHLNRLDKTCVARTFRQCESQKMQQIAAAAEYWKDPIQPEDGTLILDEIEENTFKKEWESADKLKAYTVTIQSDDPEKPESKATGGEIVRETCTPK